MRALTYSRSGGPDVLEVADLAVPEPGPGEVRVRVAFSGVNPTDWKRRRTVPPGPEGQVPGMDGSGTVDAVGPGADAVRVGERVWLREAAWERRWGTAAELTVVPARQAVPLPPHAGEELGAALGIPFLTAHRCLTLAESLPARLGPGTLTGHAVLVQGGAGAVGNAAIQLARWAGATVVATVSGPGKARLATAAGADVVVDYRSEDVVAAVRRVAPRGVDAVVEVSAAVNAGIDAQVLARHGAVAVYADDGGAQVTVPVRQQMLANARWQFVYVYTEPEHAKAAAVEDVASAVARGAVAVGEAAGLPLHVHPLDRAPSAYADVEAGAVVGKVLVDVRA